MTGHLLYIAFWYPPSRASGVYRALAVSQVFVSAGWDVTVVTADERFLDDEIGSTDKSLLSHVPEGVQVVRVPFSFLDEGEDIRSLGWARANFPTVWRALRARSASLRHALSSVRGRTPDAHQFSDRYVGWIDPVVKAGLRIDSAHPIDYVLATGNPYASFEAARIVAGLIGKPYAVDYRDPWTIDVFTGRVDNADHQTTAVERRIMAEADLCFHVNQAIADAYAAKYPESADKQHVAENGFDPESIPPPSGPSRPPFVFGILGTMNERWPIAPVYEAWARIRSGLPEGSEMVFGGHLGYFSTAQDLLEAYLPDESFDFRYLGSVPKDAVADFYASIDVVILPVPGGELVTSGKAYEALALGKPIVCVQSEGGGARRLLAGHPLTVMAEPEAGSVIAAMERAIELAKGLDVEISARVQREAARYRREIAITPIVDAVGMRARQSRPA